MMSTFVYQTDTNFFVLMTIFSSGKSMKMGWDPVVGSMAVYQKTKTNAITC